MNFASFTNWRFEYLTVAGILHAFSRGLINWSNPRHVGALIVASVQANLPRAVLEAARSGHAQEALSLVEPHQRGMLQRLCKLAPVALAALSLAACGQQNAFVAPPPPKVIVAKPLQKPAVQYVEATGEHGAAQKRRSGSPRARFP